ncbi:MAG: ABC transporter substrate-binding protein [Pseudomonadota bacterium]
MKSLLSSTILLGLMASAVAADDRAGDVPLGILFGFSGPIESLSPDMAASAELAIEEVNASGLFLSGRTIVPVRADSTCTDSAAAKAAAERLVTSDGVVAIVGADCSGVTAAVVSGVAVPNGVVSLSPSATSPGLSEIDDRGLFFRVAPSDARQGEILADLTRARGIERVAVTYTNNDYGKGLADAFTGSFQELGGTVTTQLSHEDGKADYSAEVATLAASDAEALLIIGYIDQGGRQIVQASLDTGAFERFIFPDGMIGDVIIEAFGADLGGSFGTVPGGDAEVTASFDKMATAAGISGEGPYRGESYDAAALLILAMQAAGSDDRGAIADNLAKIANAPGIPVRAGELAKGLEVLANGGEIDYVGVSNVEFDERGDASGTYREVEVEDSSFQTKGIW